MLSISGVPGIASRSAAWFAALLLVIFASLVNMPLHAQSELKLPESTSLVQLRGQIQRQLATLHANEQEHASARDIGYRWAVLGQEYAELAEFNNSENAFNRSLQLLWKDNSETALYADVLDQMGTLYRIYGRVPEALRCRRKALELRLKLGDSAEIARSQSHVAELYLMARRFKEAASGAEQAYQSMREQKDAHPSDLVSAMIVMAYAHCALHACAHGLTEAQKALDISSTAFSLNSVPVGAAMVAVGFAQLSNGQKEAADQTTDRAVQILKTQLVTDDPRLVHAMQQYRRCLLALHRKQEAAAAAVESELLAVSHDSQRECLGCTVTVAGMMSPKP